MKRGNVSILVVVLVASLVASAHAGPLDNPANPTALDHLRLGNRHLDLEHYDEAIQEYEAGALIEPVPIFWLNIGLAHRKAGRYGDAARAYRTFLAKLGDAADTAEIRAQVEEIISAMEDAATKPPTQAEPVKRDAAVAPSSEPPTHESGPVSRLTTGRKVSLFVGGGGVLALGAGLVFAIRSSGYEDDAARLCPMTTCAEADRANALLDDAEGAARNANVSYVVGGVAIAGAAALWCLAGPERSTSVGPLVSPTATGVQVTGRF